MLKDEADDTAAEHAGAYVLLFMFSALAASLGAFVFVDRIVLDDSLFIVAPIQVVLGSVVFLIGISCVVVVFSRLNLYDRSKPLALPEGSVRAIIALVLLVIFVIFANIIYGGLQSSNTVTNERFSGLTAVEIEQLSGPVVERVEVQPAQEPPVFNGLFERRHEVDADAKALGQQIVTALITLVTAISAFYFGSGTTQGAVNNAGALAGALADAAAKPTGGGDAGVVSVRGAPAGIDGSDTTENGTTDSI